jgi:hypothetical protein
LKDFWQTAEPRVILLTKEDAYIFGLYLELVYRGHLTVDQTDTMEYVASTVDHNYLVLADIYILADFLVDPHTKNIAVDTILAQARIVRLPLSWSGRFHLLGVEVINAIYSRTLEGDGARKLLVELHDSVKLADITDDQKCTSILPEFARDLTKLKRARGGTAKLDANLFQLTRYNDTPQSWADRNHRNSERADEEDSNEDHDMKLVDEGVMIMQTDQAFLCVIQ